MRSRATERGQRRNSGITSNGWLPNGDLQPKAELASMISTGKDWGERMLARGATADEPVATIGRAGARTVVGVRQWQPPRYATPARPVFHPPRRVSRPRIVTGPVKCTR